jgi:hypothetical protein
MSTDTRFKEMESTSVIPFAVEFEADFLPSSLLYIFLEYGYLAYIHICFGFHHIINNKQKPV